MSKYYLALGAMVLLTVFGQLLMKAGANGSQAWGAEKLPNNRFTRFYKAIFTPKMLLGNFVFMGVTLLSLYALQAVPLREMAIIQPIIQLLVVLAGVVLFRERISRNQWLFLLVTLLGLIVFKLDAFFPSIA